MVPLSQLFIKGVSMSTQCINPAHLEWWKKTIPTLPSKSLPGSQAGNTLLIFADELARDFTIVCARRAPPRSVSTALGMFLPKVCPPEYPIKAQRRMTFRGKKSWVYVFPEVKILQKHLIQNKKTIKECIHNYLSDES